MRASSVDRQRRRGAARRWAGTFTRLRLLLRTCGLRHQLLLRPLRLERGRVGTSTRTGKRTENSTANGRRGTAKRRARGLLERRVLLEGRDVAAARKRTRAAASTRHRAGLAQTSLRVRQGVKGGCMRQTTRPAANTALGILLDRSRDLGLLVLAAALDLAEKARDDAGRRAAVGVALVGHDAAERVGAAEEVVGRRRGTLRRVLCEGSALAGLALTRLLLLLLLLTLLLLLREGRLVLQLLGERLGLALELSLRLALAGNLLELVRLELSRLARLALNLALELLTLRALRTLRLHLPELLARERLRLALELLRVELLLLLRARTKGLCRSRLLEAGRDSLAVGTNNTLRTRTLLRARTRLTRLGTRLLGRQRTRTRTGRGGRRRLLLDGAGGG